MVAVKPYIHVSVKTKFLQIMSEGKKTREKKKRKKDRSKIKRKESKNGEGRRKE